jgi:ribosomal protein L37E
VRMFETNPDGCTARDRRADHTANPAAPVQTAAPVEVIRIRLQHVLGALGDDFMADEIARAVGVSSTFDPRAREMIVRGDAGTLNRLRPLMVQYAGMIEVGFTTEAAYAAEMRREQDGPRLPGPDAGQFLCSKCGTRFGADTKIPCTRCGDPDVRKMEQSELDAIIEADRAEQALRLRAVDERAERARLEIERREAEARARFRERLLPPVAPRVHVETSICAQCGWIGAPPAAPGPAVCANGHLLI